MVLPPAASQDLLHCSRGAPRQALTRSASQGQPAAWARSPPKLKGALQGARMGIYLAAARHRSDSPAHCEEMLTFCRCHAWHEAHGQIRGTVYQNRCRKGGGEMPFSFSHFPNTGKHQLPGVLCARWLSPTSAAALRDAGLEKILRTKSSPLLSAEKKKRAVWRRTRLHCTFQPAFNQVMQSQDNLET